MNTPLPNGCCHGRSHTMDRFVEVCVLLLLCEHTSHGYELAERLADFGFDSGQLQIGTLYKTLRRIEAANLVTSTWQAGRQGPRKRVYSITETGKQALADWILFLKSRKQKIETILSRYENSPDTEIHQTGQGE
ncbi:MAG: PadR family transcriptional regulator [Spirochaetota bacterium]